MSKNVADAVRGVVCIGLVVAAISFITKLDFIDFGIFKGSNGFFSSLGGKAKDTFGWVSKYLKG